MSIAKSLQKAGYLSTGLEGLKKFLNSLAESERQKQLQEAGIESYNKLKSIFAPEPTWEETQSQSPIQKLLPINQQQDFNKTGEPPLPPVPIDEPSLQLMPDYKSRDQMVNEANSVYADYFNKITQIKGIDTEKAKKEFDLLKMKGGLLTPAAPMKKEIKQLDPDKTTVKVDDYGNIEVISKGEPKKKYTTLGSYVNEEGYEVTILQDAEGNIQERKSENKVRKPAGTNVRIEMPKPEKWKEFGKAMNMIMYKQDENGNLVPRPENEQAKYREVALNFAKSNLTPEALNWYNNEILSKEKWGREDISSYDFLEEVKQAIQRGEITPEAAQDLIDFDPYRSQILKIDENQSVFKNKKKEKK